MSSVANLGRVENWDLLSPETELFLMLNSLFMIMFFVSSTGTLMNMDSTSKEVM